MQRLREDALPAAGVQFGDQQTRGGVPELHRSHQAQQIIPVVGDQLSLDRLAKQPPDVRIPGAPSRAGAEAVELQAADVADARAELQPGQVEDRERRKCLSGRVDGVLGERQIRWVAEDLIEYRDGLAPGAGDDLGAVGGVLIGDMGVGGGAFIKEVARQRSGVRLRPRCGNRCPSEDDSVPPPHSAASGCAWCALTRRVFAARSVSWRKYHCEVQARASSEMPEASAIPA